MPALLRPLVVAGAAVIGAAVLGVLVGQEQTVRRLNALVRQHEPAILRQRAFDGLSGKELDQAQKSWLSSVDMLPDSGAIALLWFVDVERCSGCLSQLDTWNRLASTGRHRMLLVLENAGDPVASRIAAQAGVQGEHAAMPHTSTSRLFGIAPPSTRLVLNAQRIVLADGRYPNQTCSWTAEQVVAQMAGLR